MAESGKSGDLGTDPTLKEPVNKQEDARVETEPKELCVLECSNLSTRSTGGRVLAVPRSKIYRMRERSKRIKLEPNKEVEPPKVGIRRVTFHPQVRVRLISEQNETFPESHIPLGD